MKRLSKPLFLLLLLAGILLISYPTVSNWWNGMHMSQAISNYQSAVSKMDDATRYEYLKKAEAYNEAIADRKDPYTPSKREQETYENLLNVDGDGVMGSIQIPEIDVDLPIYHGTEEKILQIGAGHVEWSALPVGGEGTHCVISGHTGLPTSKLFTDLDKMEMGDIFYLDILGETYAYKVDRILVVLPEEVNYLLPEEGKDYCTLMTCTPYGINTHRLLVRGSRIAVPKGFEHAIAKKSKHRMWMLLLLVILLILLIVLFMIHRRVRGKRTKFFGKGRKFANGKKGDQDKNETNL